MKVMTGQDKCVASGQCVLAVPDLFDQREEDGIVVLLNETPPTNWPPMSGRPQRYAPRGPSPSRSDGPSGRVACCACAQPGPSAPADRTGRLRDLT
jgi:hypothetical protein